MKPLRLEREGYIGSFSRAPGEEANCDLGLDFSISNFRGCLRKYPMTPLAFRLACISLSYCPHFFLSFVVAHGSLSCLSDSLWGEHIGTVEWEVTVVTWGGAS